MPEAFRGQKNVLDSQEKQDPDHANIGKELFYSP